MRGQENEFTRGMSSSCRMRTINHLISFKIVTVLYQILNIFKTRTRAAKNESLKIIFNKQTGY